MPSSCYCYVDESGCSETAHSFIVCTCVIDSNPQSLEDECIQIEGISKKGVRKWRHSKHAYRIHYLELILSNANFRNKIYYSVFENNVDYHDATVQSISEAVKTSGLSESHKAVVYVDGLSKKKVQEYSNKLRRQGILIRKVRGIRKEESSALLRLSDAIAGFLLDELAKLPENRSALFNGAIEANSIVET